MRDIGIVLGIALFNIGIGWLIIRIGDALGPPVRPDKAPESGPPSS